MKDHPPGCIIVPVADMMRYAQFFTSYAGLRIPKGSNLTVPRSAAVVVSFNQALYNLPDEAEWVFFLGDDHVFGPNVLMDLLDLEADVAIPLVVKRSYPYNLVAMKSISDEPWLDEDSGREYPKWHCWEPPEVPDEPFEVAAAGSAGMLVRRYVLDALTPPYFESTDGASLNEDLIFSTKVWAAGFKIICHPKVMLGHIAETVVWPAWKDDHLTILMDVGNGKTVVFKDEVPA